MAIPNKAIRNGFIAGILGGAALIIFFFFYDLFQQQPFQTPSYMAAALLDAEGVEPRPFLVGAYTVLHLIVFGLLGILLSLLCEWGGVPPNPLVGAAYGLFAGSLIFYPSLIITGTDILAAPGWPAVLVGNVIGGLVIAGYLHSVSTVPGVTGILNQLRLHKTLREGIIAGVIGGVTVAIWFLVADAMLREAFFTPGALGSILFLGAETPQDVQITLGTVVGYTLVHFAAFILFGIIVSALILQAERFPPLIFALILLFVVFETFFIVMVAMLGSWMVDALRWWVVLLGNLLAAGTMGSYLWRVHPVLREELRSDVLWAE